MTKKNLAKPGEKYKDFELKRVIELPEIHCLLKELEHNPSGARIMHIENDDDENVFCLCFQTTPDNSNGVAHILEHTVLCGSEKYPVKDPFFAMTRRSLNTFMNAFTGADFTCYPASSQVSKDFYNLLEVYIDAVFKPDLKELSFMQEGHRFEFSIPEDPQSPLELKGIVYNEMKGAMSSPDSRLSEAMDEALFPDLTYGVNSGGDPKVIPELTYQQLIDFHKKHYHPSRCLFYFYGNIPLTDHLDFIEKNALKGVEKLEPLPMIPEQPRHKIKIEKVVGYPYTAEEDSADKSLISFGWLTCHILDQETLLALSVLSTVLLGTDAAPLKKVLLKSGLCKQVSAHMMDEYSEIPVIITLKGCREENTAKLEKIIRDTLEDLIKKGLPSDLIDNAIHQLEFSRSEITGDNFPYGLTLFMRSGLLKQHGGNPEDALLIHSLSDRLRKKIASDPQYFSNLMKKYFLDNSHLVCTVAKPDQQLAITELEEEKKFLEKARNTIDAKKEKEIIAKAKKLADFQEEQASADLDVLPKVTLEDVPKKSKVYPLIIEDVGALKVFRHECFTNKIIYADLVFPLPAIEERELPLLKLFTILLPQMGCGGRPYSENLEYIQAHTGGIGVAEILNIQVHDYNDFNPYFIVEGKALYRKADKLFQLIRDITETADFSDIPRMKEVIVKLFTALQNNLNKNALRYAINLAASGLSMASRIGHAWSGLEYYYYVKEIAENLDARLPSLAEELKGMRDKVLNLENPHLIISCDGKMYQKLKSEKFYGLQDLAGKKYLPWKDDYSIPQVPRQGRVIATPVAFTSKIFKTVPYLHEDTPALNIAGNLFDNLTLHPRIREQGGAYGGGSMNNSLSGNFCFYSYRDPNISNTFAAFDEAVQRILDGNFKESDLEEAKLEIIQSLDAPLSPGSRANMAYTWLREGKTPEVRQSYRDRLLATTKMDVIKAVKKHILPMHEQGNIVVFAGKELLEKENTILIAQGKQPLKIEKV
jgi:Zn-dependent M16 (insulinase) family peptidase